MRIISMSIIIVGLIVNCNAQTNKCSFELYKRDSLAEGKAYRLSRFSLQGMDKNTSNNIVKKLNLAKGDIVYVEMDSLCRQFNSIMIYKNLCLSKIEIWTEGDNYLPDGILVRFFFSKAKRNRKY